MFITIYKPIQHRNYKDHNPNIPQLDNLKSHIGYLFLTYTVSNSISNMDFRIITLLSFSELAYEQQIFEPCSTVILKFILMTNLSTYYM
jgi:hypothetical protein